MSPDGFNCMKSVKDGDPERFKYCNDRKRTLNHSNVSVGLSERNRD